MYYENSNSKTLTILKDLSYGFYLIRNHHWIHNTVNFLQNIISDRHTFEHTMKAAIEWNPDSFSFNDRLDYLARFGVYLNMNQELKYKRLTDICISNWKLNYNMSSLKNLNYTDIFFKIIGNSKGYLPSKINTIKSWIFEPIDISFLGNFEQESVDSIHVSNEFEIDRSIDFQEATMKVNDDVRDSMVEQLQENIIDSVLEKNELGCDFEHGFSNDLNDVINVEEGIGSEKMSTNCSRFT